jgi:hypothetical protein
MKLSVLVTLGYSSELTIITKNVIRSKKTNATIKLKCCTNLNFT